MYAGDSFWTLSGPGQAGLLAVTTILSGLWLWALWRIPAPRWACAIVWFPAFLGFVWFSPQLYYLYYLTIFDGLPVQWVIRWPDPGEAVRILTFQAMPSLSDHGKAVLGWLGLVVVLRRM